jgi:hypothetical protein
VYIQGYSFPCQGVYSGIFIPMSRCIFGDTHSHFKVYIQGYPFPFQGTCIYSRFFFLIVDKYLCSTVNKAFILDVTVDCGCSMSWIYEFLLWLRILSTSCSVESMSLSFSLYDTFSLKFSFGFFFFFFFFFLLVPCWELFTETTYSTSFSSPSSLLFSSSQSPSYKEKIGRYSKASICTVRLVFVYVK